MLAKIAPQLVIVAQPDVRFSCRVTYDATRGVETLSYRFRVHLYIGLALEFKAYLNRRTIPEDLASLNVKSSAARFSVRQDLHIFGRIVSD